MQRNARIDGTLTAHRGNSLVGKCATDGLAQAIRFINQWLVLNRLRITLRNFIVSIFGRTDLRKRQTNICRRGRKERDMETIIGILLLAFIALLPVISDCIGRMMDKRD